MSYTQVSLITIKSTTKNECEVLVNRMEEVSGRFKHSRIVGIIEIKKPFRLVDGKPILIGERFVLVAGDNEYQVSADAFFEEEDVIDSEIFAWVCIPIDYFNYTKILEEEADDWINIYEIDIKE